MTANGKQDQLRLGFLTAIHLSERGYVGGLLVTNRFGRPLEFQCTTPVQPNRTQEILYGPTLRPFILGELIGSTLVNKVAIKPHLILTELDELLELRNHISIPVVCLSSTLEDRRNSPAEGAKSSSPNLSASIESSESGSSAIAVVPAVADTSAPREFSLGRQTVRLHAAHWSDDRQLLEKQAGQIPSEADLQEPLGRIRDALTETMRAAAAK